MMMDTLSALCMGGILDTNIRIKNLSNYVEGQLACPVDIAVPIGSVGRGVGTLIDLIGVQVGGKKTMVHVSAYISTPGVMSSKEGRFVFANQLVEDRC